MLEKFRNVIQGWFGKTLIVILLLPFAFFGISSIFQVNPNRNIVAEVNDQQISETDLLRAMEISKQTLISQLGEQASSFITNEMLRPSTLNNLIDQALLKQSAEDNGLQVSTQVIHKMIADMEAFQVDGKFSQQRYEALLRSNGLSPETFPQRLREDLLLQQNKNGYLTTGFATKSEINVLQELKNQTRTFQYARLDAEQFIDKVKITDQQVEDYYNKNKEQFQTEESLSLDYLVINKNDYVGTESPAEDEINQKYQEKVAEIKDSEERSASHILIEVNDKRNKAGALKLAEEVYSSLSKGEDFATLAKQHSEDKGSAATGGSLGFAGHGAYVEEFEKALYSLKLGEFSKPILTEFGYHLIRLDGIRPEIPGLEQIKPQLIEAIKLAKAQQPYQDALESLKNLAYESSNLDEAAAFLQKKVLTSEAFTQSGEASSNDVISSSAVRELAFSKSFLESGNNSEVIELDDNRAVVFRIHAHNPSKIKDLADVKPELLNKLKELGAEELSKKMAGDILTELKAGVSLQALADKYTLGWKKAENVSRDETAYERELLDAIFKQAKPGSAQPVYTSFPLTGSSTVVAVLESIGAETKEETSKESNEMLKQTLENQKGLVELSAYQAWLKENAEIKIR